MKFTLSALAVLALTGAVSASDRAQRLRRGDGKHHRHTITTSPTSSGPVTPTDPSSSISSIVAYMSDIKPTHTAHHHHHKHGHKHDKGGVDYAAPTIDVALFANPTISGIYTNVPIPTAACAAMPTFGFNYIPTNNTISGFLADTNLGSSSLNAGNVAGFNWNYATFFGAVTAPGYITYAQMSNYNVSACAAFCNSVTGCNAFNIYYERDPSILPGAGCSNPAPQVGIHCALFSQPFNYTQATNVGQWTGTFEVVITGANGYNRIGNGIASSGTPILSVPSSTATAAPIVTAGSFTIVSALLANTDMTAAARTNFLTGGGTGLSINTNTTAAGVGTSNPFSPATAPSNMTLSVLYTYQGQFRLFTAPINTGTYVQQAGAWSATTCPGSSLLTNVPSSAGSGVTVLCGSYGAQQITVANTNANIWTQIGQLIFGNTGATITNSFFNISATAVSNSLDIWFYINNSTTGQPQLPLYYTAGNQGQPASVLQQSYAPVPA